MSKQAPVARVLVLTEDGSATAVGTVQSLLRHLLVQVARTADLDRVDLAPIPESRARKVLPGNVWKSAKKTAGPGVVDLAQRIATRLVLDDGFVVQHLDGDRVWGERGTSENVLAFQNVISRRVRANLRHSEKLDATEIDAHMRRLLVLVPFWCIEAWLFQNTLDARTHCSHTGHQCSQRLDAWAADRTLLDEVPTPKDLLCFGTRHNLALAGPLFPSDELLAAGKSYAAAVQTLCDCEAPTMALKRSTVIEPLPAGGR